LVTFPNGTRFEVTLACSGVVFLVQGLAVAVLLGELEQASTARRVRLVGSMVAVALIANWIRVLALLQIGYSTNMRNVLVSRDHLEFGWALFVVVLVAFVWLATRRALPEGAKPTPVSGARSARSRGAYLAAAVALAIAPLLIGVTATFRDVQAEANQLSLPPAQANWRGPLETVDQSWRPMFVGAHEERHVAYEDTTGHSVEAVAIGYSWQEQGQELINEGNSLLGDGGLTSLTSGVVQGNGRSYWELIVADSHGGQSVVWAFYDIGGRGFVTPLFSQLWYGVRSLASPPYSTLFAFRVQCAPSCEAARATLSSFLHGKGNEPVAVAAPAS
jgi:EpsI family protein